MTLRELSKRAQAAASELRPATPLERNFANSGNPLWNAYVNLRYNPTGKRDDFLSSLGILTTMFGIPNLATLEGAGAAGAAMTAKLPWLQRGLRALQLGAATANTAAAVGTAAGAPSAGNLAAAATTLPIPGAAAVQKSISMALKVDALRKQGGWRKTAAMTKLVPLEVLPGSGGPVKATVRAEIADTPAARMRGLSGRDRLPDKCGMFFDTPGPFWMRGCRMPLDLLFLTKSGTVLEHVTMPVAEDGRLPLFSTDKAGAACALEVSAGWCERHGVRPGDRIRVGGVK